MVTLHLVQSYPNVYQMFFIYNIVYLKFYITTIGLTLSLLQTNIITKTLSLLTFEF